MKGCTFGTHRVLEPKGTLPQGANKISNTMELASNEVLIEVDTLNIDAASFTQIKKACNKDIQKMKEMISQIVEQRGKMQNPVTGSGGMLIGTVKEIGKDYPHNGLQVGDRLATLVSLSLTPLEIEEILEIHLDSDQVDIKGKAILFRSGIYAKIPKDMPDKVALASLDVAGAPAQVNKLVQEGQKVLIIGGGGKSGLLCCYQAMKNLNGKGQLIVVEANRDNAKRLMKMHLAHHVLIEDARKSVDIYEQVMALTKGEGVDVTINNVNIPDTEMASILPTKDEGTVYFFSMATSFTKAALGAEGVGKDINMIIGNGYTKGHAELTLNILRESEELRDCFYELYAH